MSDRTAEDVGLVASSVLLLATVVLGTLKLAGHAEYNWVVVFSPLWGAFLLAYVVQIINFVLRDP